MIINILKEYIYIYIKEEETKQREEDHFIHIMRKEKMAERIALFLYLQLGVQKKSTNNNFHQIKKN